MVVFRIMSMSVRLHCMCLEPAMTDQHGCYSFKRYIPGVYDLYFAKPEGFDFSPLVEHEDSSYTDHSDEFFLVPGHHITGPCVGIHRE